MLRIALHGYGGLGVDMERDPLGLRAMELRQDDLADQGREVEGGRVEGQQSTVGTPVMSMMANSDADSRMRCSSSSMTSWVRELSRVPIMGSASTPSHSLTTGVDSRCHRLPVH